MKRFVYVLFFLAMATYTWAATSPSMQRILATSPKVTADAANTATKAYIFVAYSSASGMTYRRADLDSVLKLGGIETTAPDGDRYINPGNTSACPATAPALSICTLPSGAYWNPSPGSWEKLGVTYDDTALWAKFADYWARTEHDIYANAVKARLDNYSTQIHQLKAAVAQGGGTLMGDAPPAISALDFGSVNVNQTKTLTTSLTNSGLGDLTVSGAAISGTGSTKFAATGGCNGQTLIPGATCAESVVFAPGATAGGPYTATLTFTHNALSGTTTTAALSGTGAAVQACSATPYANIASSVTTATPVANGTANTYSGLIVDAGSATHTVCKAAFYIANIGGGISGLSYQAEIWSTDGSKALTGTAKAISTAVSGLTMSVGSYVVFTFPTPTAMVVGDALVITRTDHGNNSTNFIEIAYSSTNVDSGYGHSARWYNTLALGSENTAQDKRIQIYEVQ